LRSLDRLRSNDLGFRPEGMTVLQMFPKSGSEEQKMSNRVGYFHELLDRLQGNPRPLRLPVIRTWDRFSSYEFKKLSLNCRDAGGFL